MVEEESPDRPSPDYVGSALTGAERRTAISAALELPRRVLGESVGE